MSSTTASNTVQSPRPMWLTFLRIILGIILLWKGIVFIRDTEQLKLLIQETGIGTFSENADTLAMVIAILTLVCGVFISIGLFTRIAAIVQIPVVLIGTVFVNAKDIERSGFELFVSIVVLILLVLFAVKGRTALSADGYFNLRKENSLYRDDRS